MLGLAETTQASCRGCCVGIEGGHETTRWSYARCQARATGHDYATTIDEAIKDVAIITCTLLIHSSPIVALFDSGSTHTFVAKTFVDRIGVSIEDLGYDLILSTPAGAILTTSVCDGSHCSYPIVHPFD